MLPIARSVHAQGAGAAFVIAFLLATPELGIETFALTWQFFGFEFAVMRLGASILLATVAALMVAWTTERSRRAPAVSSQRLLDSLTDVAPDAGLLRRFF